MPIAEIRLGLAAFALLAAGVAVNLLGFQETRRSGDIETSALGNGSRTTGVSRHAEGTQSPVLAERDLGPAAPEAGAPVQPKAAALAALPESAVNRGEIIRGVQRELNTRGYGTGQPDGVAGLLTRASIMAYEYDYGLSLTAEPSQEFLSRIVLGTAGPAAQLRTQPQIKTTEAETVVKTVKQYLANIGYAPGKADGKLNDDLIRAIRDCELDQKLPETGRISAQLVSRLIRLQGQGKTAAKR